MSDAATVCECCGEAPATRWHPDQEGDTYGYCAPCADSLVAEDASAATEQHSDPFAKGGDRHWLWWADGSYIRPGLFFRHRRIVPVSDWIIWKPKRSQLRTVALTTGGKDHFAYVTRWGLLRAVFSRPGKDVYL